MNKPVGEFEGGGTIYFQNATWKLFIELFIFLGLKINHFKVLSQGLGGMGGGFDLFARSASFSAPLGLMHIKFL